MVIVTLSESHSATAAGPSLDRILDAADACLDRWGMRRMSMNDVATEAGLSRGSIYRYFPDREALVEAVLARRDKRFLADVAPRLRKRRTLATQVAEAALFVGRGRSPSEVDEPGMAAIRLARTEGVLAHWIDFWVPFLEAARDRGEVRADLDLRQAGEWIMRILVSLSTMPSVTFDPSDPAQVRRYIEAHVVRGFM